MFNRARVQPELPLPHIFFIRRDFQGDLEPVDNDYQQAYAWCVEQFGPGLNRWISRPPDDTRWIYSPLQGFAFRYEDDAFAFKMRWC